MNDFKTKKNLADQLSSLLPINEESSKSHAFEVLKKLGFNHMAEGTRGVPQQVHSYPTGNIGIWKPKTIDDEIIYERDIDTIDRWTHFSKTMTFNKKKDKRKRIAFLGESVARGLLLDPDYTPALVLDKLLNTNSSQDKFEIIDLAETHIPMWAIKDRFIECLDLQPDVVVFFAGNNWYRDLILEVKENKDVFNELNKDISQKGNIGDIKPHLEKVFEKLVIDFLTVISQKMKEHKFKVIMCIPEFNLMDCPSIPAERRVTYLSGDGIKRWLDALKKAKEAQSQGDQEKIAIRAQDLINIDNSHPLGYEMLAGVKIEQQDYESARELLETARDTALFSRSNSTPRVFQVIRRTILKYAPELGIESLDMAEVFKRHLNGKLPGKEHFLDYCHFTPEGIQVAMEPLSDILLSLTGNQNKQMLQAASIKAPKLTAAMGYFYAAILNMYWGQPYDLQRYFFQKALKTSSEVAKTMIYYCDMMTRNAPNNLTKSLEMILGEDINADYHGRLYLHPKIMVGILVDAAVDSLKMQGKDLTKFIHQLRIKEHGVKGKNIDLLNLSYHATSLYEFEGIRPAFYQATDTVSEFYIYADKGESIDLSISFRIPSFQQSAAKVKFYLNNSPIAALDAQTNWVSHELVIPGKYCKKGINELTIHWPIPETVDRPTNIQIGDSRAIINLMYYVFGQISHFKASGVKKSASQEDKLKTALA